MRVISIKKESIIFFICVCVMLCGIFGSIQDNTEPAIAMPLAHKIIVIDAGHGGWDPGKVSKNILEKDLNLSISKKLQQYLEQSGASVLMTRTTDEALGNRKRDDFLKRKELANSSRADVFISIHQNSFEQAKVKGAQIFYFANSEPSQRLATCIQNELKKIAEQNNRPLKTDSSYYMLKKLSIPSVIIECGFLSNQSDLDNLSSDDYQNKLAWAMYMGILKYFEI